MGQNEPAPGEAPARAAATPVRLLLLGTPALWRSGTRTDLPETAPAYLGLFLAAQPGWVARERVADHLWPEASTERAQHNLRVALNRLGALLQGLSLGDALQAERRRVQLTLPSDLAEFREHLARADWARAAALPAGVFLDGQQFSSYPALAEWLAVERAALQRSWRKALVEAAALGVVVDEPLARYVAVHPADAEAATLLAARLAAAGRPVQAQEVISAYERATAEALGESTLHDAQAPLRHMAHSVAMLTPVDATAAPGALLGRRAELAALDAATQGARWVTVMGLGGAGKSSLVLAWLAARATSPQALPTVRVALHERSTAAAVADTLVQALAIKGASAAVAGSRLERLAPLQGLVVLDGLDPAMADAELMALLGAVASGCPGLRVLATSRATLRVAGERLHRLGGLSLRRGEAGAPSEAAQLFLREVQRIRPSHRWATLGEEAERVAALCEGLPLALKLAASWSRWVEPAQLTAELERSLHGAAGALDATLHAWLLAPWQRLAQQQQQALAALSLFPADFGMGEAAAMAARPAQEIESLVSACLLDATADEPPRLHLHPLVRRFAAARLQEAPAQQRSAITRFLAVVDTRLGPRPHQHGQPLFSPAQVRAAIDLLLAAWPLALQTGAQAELSLLAEALLVWHESQGEFRAGAALLQPAEAACDDTVPTEAALQARLRTARATLLYRAGDHDAAGVLAQAALRGAEASGQRRVARRALNTLGLSLWMRLRLKEAEAAFQRGLQSAIEDGEQDGEARFSSNLALVAKARGDHAAAEAGMRRALAVYQDLNDPDRNFSTLNNLSNLLRSRGRFSECEPLALEALRLTHEHGLTAQRPFALIGLALLHQATGRPEQAEPYLDLIDDCPPDSVEGAVQAGSRQLRARLALDRGDGEAALQHVAAALRITLDTDDPANRAEALALHGDWLAQHAGRPDEALSVWAALLASPEAHAELKDSVKAQLQRQGLSTGGARPVDLALAVEQALAEAHRRAR